MLFRVTVVFAIHERGKTPRSLLPVDISFMISSDLDAGFPLWGEMSPWGETPRLVAWNYFLASSPVLPRRLIPSCFFVALHKISQL
jgi:hypothetical protein